MELTYAELSSPGPVRPKNEDYVGFWFPDDLEERRTRGAIAILADGVGGQGKGEVASRLGVENGLKAFREAKPGATPQQLLHHSFKTANLAIYDKGMEGGGRTRMATTLAMVIFRGNQIFVGNVGDSRVYLIRAGQIKQVTTDHSYVAMQSKLGLISAEEAKLSENRSILTRSVGMEPIIRVDTEEETVAKGDRILLCSDGLHAVASDTEIYNIVTRNPPAQACRQLVALAEKNGTDDNISVQVIQVDQVEQHFFFRGNPVFYKSTEKEPENTWEDVRPGDTLDDRFFINEVLSRSGMGTVYKAMDRTTNQYVALKVPHLHFESDPGFFTRFEREEEIGSKLNHPYILKFIPVANKSRPYIVTEYLKGYTLAHLLHNVRPLPVRDALKITARICDALTYLHSQGIIHRDLKPANVMICYDGSIRLMDFGIAKSEDARRVTFTGFTPAVGTPDYMAPEQVKGKRGDQRTDIYSLGAMLYEMLTGHPPFEGENPLVVMNVRLTGDPPAPRKFNPEISPSIEEIILHAMERDPNRRYPSAAAMKADLDAPDRVEVTGRAERLKEVKSWKPQRRWMRVIAMSLIVPLVLTLLFLLLMWHPPHR